MPPFTKLNLILTFQFVQTEFGGRNEFFPRTPFPKRRGWNHSQFQKDLVS